MGLSRGGGRARRRGFTLVETGIAAVMLAVAMTIAVQALARVAAERRGVDRRRRAVQEVANVMERFTSRSWAGLSPEAARAVTISEPARRTLPDAELGVFVAEAPHGLKRVSVRLRWKDRAGGWDAPVRLTSWVCRRGEGPR